MVSSNNSQVHGYKAYVELDNGSFQSICNRTAIYAALEDNATAQVICPMPVGLANGTWTINVTNEYNSSDYNTTVSFTLNRTNMSISIAQPKSFAPNYGFVYYVNTTYVNGSQFDINTTFFSISLNVSYIANCSTNLTRIETGYYNATCVVNGTANASSYAFRGFYPNSNGTDILSVNVTYATPNAVLNISNVVLERNNQTNVTITIRSNSNINETLNVTISAACDGSNITCLINVSQVSLPAFGYANVSLSVNANASANATTYSVAVNVTSFNTTANYNQTFLSVIVNPYHNFIITSISGVTGSIDVAKPVICTFYVNNTGETSTTFNFSCVNNNTKFTCSFNTTNNSVTVIPNNTMDVNITVTLLTGGYEGETAKTNITVTDSRGLSRLLEGDYYKTSILSSLGNVTVTNVSQYVHYAGETYNFNISINNTGNVGTDTLYNITIYAQNTTGWILNVTNYSNLSNFVTMNNSYILNLTLNISALSHQNISVRVAVPSGATAANYTKLFIKAVSATNSSRFSENATVVIKLPDYIVSVNMQFNNAFGAERLNWTIVNITREPSVGLNLSMLNCSILSPNGTVQTFFNATYGTTYSNASNATAQFNVSNWPTGAYNLTLVGGGSDNYNFTWTGTFYIARWVVLTGSVLSYTMATGTSFNVTVSNVFGATSISVNASSASSPITYITFGSGGGSCISTPYVNTSYIFSCTTSTATNTSYYLNITSLVSSCSRDFSCTFVPTLSNKTALNISETYSPGTTGDGQQNAPPSSNATNRTTTTTTGLKFTMPSNVTLLNTSQTIYIPLNNTNTSRQNVSVNISEAGDYIHFSLTYVASKNISGNSTSSINVTLTPFKWARPGTYTVSVRINSVNSSFTVTLPAANDTKKIHRYVEVSKNRTKSMITISVKNRNSYSVFMNITENISKQIAASAKNLTITSAINYTVIEQDPVILWTMNMSPNQERSIVYLAAGDLGNSNLFTEPNITEWRMSTGGGGGGAGGGGDMTWLIVGIIVVVVIAAAVVAYLFFLKPRGVKLPIKYGAFVKQEKKGEGVLGVLKGITAKIMSVFKRGEKKEAPVGEKKSIFSRLSFKKKAEIKEEPKKEEKKIAPGKPKPTKEDLLKKLNEVYKK
jgi:hypothetical protein